MLVSLLIALVVIALIYYALTNLPLPPMVRQIGTVLLVIVAALYLIGLATGRHILPT
jgi:heme A synthase